MLLKSVPRCYDLFLKAMKIIPITTTANKQCLLRARSFAEHLIHRTSFNARNKLIKMLHKEKDSMGRKVSKILVKK